MTLKAEIGRVATTTKFNGTALLDGSFTTQKFQVGANSGETVALDAIANVKHAAPGSLTPPSTYINTRPAIGFTDAAAATRRVKDRAVEVDKKRKPDTRQHPDRPRSPPHVQQPPSPRRAPPSGAAYADVGASTALQAASPHRLVTLLLEAPASATTTPC